METECPHCGFKEVVFNQYAGEVGICGKCGHKYVVGQKIKCDDRPTVCETSNSELLYRIDSIGRSILSVTDPKEIVSLKDELLEIKAKVAERHLAAQKATMQQIQKTIPPLLRPLAQHFAARRVPEGEETSPRLLMQTIESTLREIENRLNDFKGESERQLAIGKFKDEISKAIESLKLNRLLVPIYCKYFSYQEGEVVYYVERNVECKVPSQTKCEYYEGGRFVVTNMRLVYTAEKHMQTYDIKSIRDFKPCWRLDAGWLSIATCDKQVERYKFNTGWYPTVLIMYLSNDLFVEQLETQDIKASTAYVWNKIIATSSPLHSKLFDIQDGEHDKKESELSRKSVEQLAGDEIDVLLASNEIGGPLRRELNRLQYTIRDQYSLISDIDLAYKKYLRMRKAYGFIEILEKIEMKDNLQRRACWLMKA